MSVRPSVYLRVIYVHNYHDDDCGNMNIYPLLMIVGVNFRCGLVAVQWKYLVSVLGGYEWKYIFGHRQQEAESELRTNRNIDLTNKCNQRVKGLCVLLTIQRSLISYPGALARGNKHFKFCQKNEEFRESISIEVGTSGTYSQAPLKIIWKWIGVQNETGM